MHRASANKGEKRGGGMSFKKRSLPTTRIERVLFACCESTSATPYHLAKQAELLQRSNQKART